MSKLVAVVVAITVLASCASGSASPTNSSGRAGHPLHHATGAHHSAGVPAIALSAAKQVLDHYEVANNAADASLNLPTESTVETGAQLIADAAAYRIAKGEGGSALASAHQAWRFVNPTFSIPASVGYPKYFAVTAGETGSSGVGEFLFEQQGQGSTWKLAASVGLGKNKRPPAISTAVPTPLSLSAAASRNADSLAQLISGDLVLSSNPASSLPCAGPAKGFNKSFALTGYFVAMLSANQRACKSAAADHVTLNFYWSTTSWPVVSLPTSSGGAVSMLALNQHAVFTAGSPLRCPSGRHACSVFLSPSGHYPEINDQSLCFLFVVTPHASSARPVPLDLIGASCNTLDVTSSGQ
ncbi:MAG: hypothetical protein ACYDC0_16990 [Acidimicrobiales bacterium]